MLLNHKETKFAFNASTRGYRCYNMCAQPLVSVSEEWMLKFYQLSVVMFGIVDRLVR